MIPHVILPISVSFFWALVCLVAVPALVGYLLKPRVSRWARRFRWPRPWARSGGATFKRHSSLALRRAIAWLPDHASKSDRAGEAWHRSPGAIYPTIAQLEDEGLLTTRDEGGSRLVTITIQGACATGGAQSPTRRPVRRLRQCVNSPDPRDLLHQLQRRGTSDRSRRRRQTAPSCSERPRPGAAAVVFDLGGRRWASELKAVASLVFTDASQLANRFSTAQAQPSS